MRKVGLKKIILTICISIFTVTLISCEQEVVDKTEALEIDKEEQFKEDEIDDSKEEEKVEEETILTKEEFKFEIVEKYKDRVPEQWGEKVQGVTNAIDTNEKIIFLTFDACGGKSNGYDKELIDFLIEEQVEANLFLNNRWIEANMEIFKELASNDLFAIESHGYEHRPLSVNGKGVYGIEGTKCIEEVFDEVTVNDQIIEEITGQKPRFFRSGTAYYDEVAVDIAKELGKEIAGFNILGDGGATFSKTEIINRFNNPINGSISILHMNHPESQVYEAMKIVIPQLKSEGYSFKKLRDYI